MAISEVKICNMALVKLGANRIESLLDESNEAINCNLFYETVRDSLLREHAWNFAEKHASLAKLSEPPKLEYKFAYAKPADCLNARQLASSDSKFIVVGKHIYTDIDDAKLIYTARIEDPTFFDPNFIEALSGKLGAEICESVTGTTTKVQMMNTLYLNAMQKARTADAAEGRKEIIEADPWLEARGIAATPINTLPE